MKLISRALLLVHAGLVACIITVIAPTHGYALTELGKGVLSLEVDAGIAYDSNVFTNNLEEDDFIARLTSLAKFRQAAGILHLEAALGGEFGEFQDFREQSYQDLISEFKLSGLHRDHSPLKFELKGGWKEDTTSSEELGVWLEREIAELTGYTDLVIREKAGIRIGASVTDFNYLNNNLANSKDAKARIDALHFYSDKLTFKAGYRYRDINYEDGYIDHKADSFIAGFEGVVSPKVRGLLELGYTLQDSDLSDFLFYKVALAWIADEKRQLSITGLRDNDVSALGTSIINTSLVFSFQQKLSKTMSGSIFAGMGNYKLYGQLARSDDVFRAGGAIAIQLKDAGELDFALNFENRDSDTDFYNFSRLMISVGWNADF